LTGTVGLLDDQPDPEPVRVDVQMLVRRPPREVWRAFVEPDEISEFWLARSSHRLGPGVTAHWQFKVATAETNVTVIDAVEPELLDLRWDDGQPLRITLEGRGDATLVHVSVSGFDGDAPVTDAIETASGFTLVLASLKMWLEHGIAGDLMYDRFPDATYADR
jgi:uncharacterized protein YndB with AHSA1/START domain